MLICDTHCDTLYRMAKHPRKKRDVTPERLRTGGVSLQTMAMFVGDSSEIGEIETFFPRMERALARWKKNTGMKQVLSPLEAVEGESRIMLSVEGCDLLSRGMEVLDHWEEIGVRMAALTWNYPNCVAEPHCGDQERGLTPFGREAVRAMQRKKIAVDVSHLNARGVEDLLEMGVVPLASHSCCRALCDVSRNLTDEQLRHIFAAGGYVGVNFYTAFLKAAGPASISDVLAHMEHMMACGGEGKIGFGSDFDGITSAPEGLKHPGDLPALADAMRERFGEETARGIAGENLLRYWERIA